MPNDLTPPPALAELVRRARKRQGLTLEGLSALCGVSKSMLSQIERGAVNPTFTTVWNITRALGIDLASVEGSRAVESAIVCTPGYATPSMGSADGKCRLRALNPLHTALAIEWYDFTAEPGGAQVSQPHLAGTVEHLTCLTGCLEVEAGGVVMRAETGDTLRYRADRPHAIRNPGDGAARALLVVDMSGQSGSGIG
ncbi:helix-turn-helix transcriptional regulator [Limibaculum sp. M0105]|uniref:Helix-turn-helix transcriptional regulator n=1 Tax=Thermohalobaculum xanthum TaxID=2753746 RepID=A0A8J7M3V0_9RHOB|nr:XRE family transcriptional regulator [Thermohalobaculum xanthum]MBK0397605.1 helix-turn-helix transcriptional regulator [Thermohalobaculum xanthum]